MFDYHLFIRKAICDPVLMKRQTLLVSNTEHYKAAIRSQRLDMINDATLLILDP